MKTSQYYKLKSLSRCFNFNEVLANYKISLAIESYRIVLRILLSVKCNFTEFSKREQLELPDVTQSIDFQEYLLYAKNLCWAFVLCVEYRNDEIKFFTRKVCNSVAATKHMHTNNP